MKKTFIKPEDGMPQATHAFTIPVKRKIMMRPIQIRIAIAESVGGIRIRSSEEYKALCSDWENDHENMYKPGRIVVLKEGGFPDYPNDLNAMHEVEKTLNVNQWTDYLEALDRVCVPIHICPTTHSMAVICACAMERCEAYLRTIGKWPESGDGLTN